MNAKKHSDLLDRESGQPTPGTWRVGDIHYYDSKNTKPRAYIYADRDNYFGRVCVAEAKAETVIQDELLANAHLIAAAPDMLAALKDAKNWLTELTPCDEPDDGLRGMIQDIRAAIAKAEGGAS